MDYSLINLGEIGFDLSVDFIKAFNRALAVASEKSASCEISIPYGIYTVSAEQTNELDIHVSNTHEEGTDSSKEQSDSIKRISPMLLKNVSNVTINGNNSLIYCDGKMTQIILKDCENVTIKNISFDYINSTVAEITMVEQGKGYIDCTVGTGCCYKIIDGQIVWFGKNFFFSGGLTQIFDPETGYTWRHWGPMQDKTAVWQELSPNLIRISYDCDEPETNPYGVKTGNILQLRDPLRDECGIIIDNCVNTTFVNTTMYFMNGLGVIAQNSNGIYFNGFNSFPSIGRNTACFADFMHFSGCRGLIEIKNGIFIGAHDDAINVHGTHLKIIESSIQRKILKLRFMHPQTFGIGGFNAGDIVAAVNPETLIELSTAVITDVKELSPREILLSLDEIDENFIEGMMIENISANSEVIIKNNFFSRIPTRGILVSTRGKVLIEDNTFDHIMGNGVLIADDARSWYESGPVKDVTIRNNVYRSSKGNFVVIKPECVSESELAVHTGISITDNRIELKADKLPLIANNTDRLLFSDNIVYGRGAANSPKLEKVYNSIINTGRE